VILQCGECGNIFPGDWSEEPCSRCGSKITSEIEVAESRTGGRKQVKPERYSLIPVVPLAEVARVYDYGARKYAEHNWTKGYDFSLSYDAAQRHMNAFWAGAKYDTESGCHHLASAIFHMMALMTYDLDEHYEEYDNRPSRMIGLPNADTPRPQIDRKEMGEES